MKRHRAENGTCIICRRLKNFNDYCMTVMRALVQENDKLIMPVSFTATDTFQTTANRLEAFVACDTKDMHVMNAKSLVAC